MQRSLIMDREKMNENQSLLEKKRQKRQQNKREKNAAEF